MSLPSISRRDLLVAAAVVALILVVTLVTVSSPVPGSALRARAAKAADAAGAKLTGPSTLAKIAPQITGQFAAPGDSISVFDTQGHALSQGSGSSALNPGVSPAAIRASLAGSDVRLTAWDGSRQSALALAPVRSSGRAAGVVAASGPAASSSGVGAGRTAVILVCAGLLGALGLLVGRKSGKAVVRGTGAARAGVPTASDPSPVPSEQARDSTASRDRLVAGLLELEEIAPSGVFLERIQATLTGAGVQANDPVGKPFDPRLHRAVERVSTPDPALHNTIAETLRPGYSLGERVLRQPQVAVYRHSDE